MVEYSHWKLSSELDIGSCSLMSLYSVVGGDSLRAGRSWDRIPSGARISTPLQTGPGVRLLSYIKNKGSFQGEGGKGAGSWH